MNRSRSARFAAFTMPSTMRIRRLLDKSVLFLTETDVTLVEFCSSTTLLLVGILLAPPNAKLDQSIPLFHTMTTFLPEWAWAILFLAFGAFQSIANLSHNRGAQRYAAFCAFLFFGFIGLLGAAVRPISLLGAAFAVQSCVNVIVYWHLGVRGAK
jgi:hypothetical protein